RYSLGSLRYDLSKLRAKGLVEKLPAHAATDCRPRGFTLPDLLEARRSSLRAPCLCTLQPGSRRCRLPSKKALAARSPLSAAHHRTRPADTRDRPCIFVEQREQNSRWCPHNGLGRCQTDAARGSQLKPCRLNHWLVKLQQQP